MSDEPHIIFHVITACSRPRHLSKIAYSLAESAEGYEVYWHIKFDLERKNIGGYKLKNDILDQVHDGYVWFLDDDTTVHPELFKEVSSLIIENNYPRAVVFSQKRSVDGGILQAAHANLRSCGVDMGQVILRRDAFGDIRFNVYDYCSDGATFGELLAFKDDVVIYDVPLSLFNFLRPS